jgi:SIR2-like domain
MQLVKNGPEIPDTLLQAHEEGQVVFFCGAGIPYPAGLPGFEGLALGLYDRLGTPPTAVEQAALNRDQYDTAIGLLEGRHVGGREAVRQEVARILTPDFTRPHALATHDALLTLSRTRKAQYRLITTNFDRIFERVIADSNAQMTTYLAPLLPLPKNRLDGLVYLHGLLPETPTKSELDCLVLSSGDFGLAYLIERWAARFVSELFRNFTICFVGYSINDPVLRYMMDALAADRLLGETPSEVFAFGSYSKRHKDEAANEWKAKNVTPILYQEHHHHFYLHRTLQTWAANYRDGAETASLRPPDSNCVIC